LGIGDWGLGFGGWGPSPNAPKPQTQDPNPKLKKIFKNFKLKILKKNKIKF